MTLEHGRRGPKTGSTCGPSGGTAVVTVTKTDTGGTANGGVNTATATFNSVAARIIEWEIDLGNVIETT